MKCSNCGKEIYSLDGAYWRHYDTNERECELMFAVPVSGEREGGVYSEETLNTSSYVRQASSSRPENNIGFGEQEGAVDTPVNRESAVGGVASSCPKNLLKKCVEEIL